MIVTDVKVVHSAKMGLRTIDCSIPGLYTGTMLLNRKASKRSYLTGEREGFGGSQYLAPSVMGDDMCMACNSRATTFLNAVMNLCRSAREPKRQVKTLRSMMDVNAVARENTLVCGLRLVQSTCESRRSFTLGNREPGRRNGRICTNGFSLSSVMLSWLRLW